jgi:hypothetical protein
MSFLPHFDNWQSALLGAGLAIPALLILYFLKLRRKEMPVSSTFLWKKAIQDLQVNAPFQRLRKNLLLLLQLLLLLALLLAFARPVVNYIPGPGKQTILLIDRSASMSAKDVDGHTRLEEAKKRAKELVRSMNGQTAAMVIAFDDSAETMQAYTTDQATLLGAIDRIQGTDRKTRMKLAYQLADAQANNMNKEQLRPVTDPPDVRLYSDGRALDDKELALKAKLVFEKIGSDTAKNIAIVALNAKRNYEHPTQVQVFAHLANFGPEPAEAPVQFSDDAKLLEVGGARTQRTFLLPNRWDQAQRDAWELAHPDQRSVDGVHLEFELPNRAVIRVEQLNKDGDMLAADDVAQVVVPPPKSLSVLLVTPSGRRANPFLQRVVTTSLLKQHDIMDPVAYEGMTDKDKLAQYDVIIFDRYKPAYVPEVGNFMFFLDGAKAALPDIPEIGLKISRNPDGSAILLKDIGILDWKRDHPIFKDLDISSMYIKEAVKFDKPEPRDEVLVDGLKGPLMVLDHTGKRTSLVIGFDSLKSDFPMGYNWPMFMYYAMQYLALGSDMSLHQSLEPGATPTIPRSNLQKIGNPATIKLKGPDGSDTTVRIPPTGDVVLPALNHVGVYSTDPPVPQFEKIAVNLLDASESNLMPADKAPGDSTAQIETRKAGRTRLDLWWWLVAALGLPLLMIEWWVYTRRVHL